MASQSKGYSPSPMAYNTSQPFIRLQAVTTSSKLTIQRALKEAYFSTHYKDRCIGKLEMCTFESICRVVLLWTVCMWTVKWSNNSGLFTATLEGDTGSMLTHTYPHKPLRKIDCPLCVYPGVWSWWFASLEKFNPLRKIMVIHDTKCPYWDQVSLNNINQTFYSK